VRDDELLLSTLVHEQLHWFLVLRQKDTDAAIKELRMMFPAVPARPPEGAQDEHTFICSSVPSEISERVGDFRLDVWR
jgi:hypothetical protein